MAGQEKFMTIAGIEAYKSKSFETPTGDTDRAALRSPAALQALTRPAPIPSASASTSSTSTSAFSASTSVKPSITNAAELPAGQELLCTAQFAFFSPEELRYYAYLRGNITAPATVKMDPFVKSDLSSSSTTTASASASTATTAAGTLDSGETLQSIMAQSAFADHCFEELRVYYLLAGRREVTSAEIRTYLGQAAPTPTPAPALPPAPGLPLPPLPTSSLATSLTVPATPAAPTSATAPQQPFMGGGSISTPLPIQPKATPSFSFKF
ncbi:hypothetical protein FA13DRAFT_1725529 [Coprinellus micaceus]|uniref:Uncharacterized protein n=1 Tax=Coprinellus micaceus TaxID=71717 RepID=A0A4Y7TWF8_COPMI|nr:hypothetical protein FA13DRAFT_1725529 [Coprinellus micaceus]